jgi:putative Holliday junction resolvase
MKVAALDYGRKRVGLAVCDPLGITIRGLPTLVRTVDEAAFVEAVSKALRDEGAERLVVGVALREDGRDSVRGAEARAFGTRVAEAAGVPVEFHDEGLTTWETEADLREAGASVRRARATGDVDRAAAVAILRSWLGERGGG